MTFWVALAAGLGLAFFLKGTREEPARRGGVAVFGALLLTAAGFYGTDAFFTLRVFWFCLALLFVMGAVDDWIALSPLSKLAFQVVVATTFLVYSPPGVWATGIHDLFGPYAFPLLLFWLVGITNALNLLDNMDGLAAGVAAVIVLSAFSLDLGALYLLLPLAGALLGFLVVNLYRAPIYLGDAGSHVVGFSLAVLPLYGLPTRAAWWPLLLFAIPIADTTFVTVTRLLRGQSPFEGGKDHLSHRLERLGLSTWQVCLLFYGLAGLSAGVVFAWAR